MKKGESRAYRVQQMNGRKVVLLPVPEAEKGDLVDVVWTEQGASVKIRAKPPLESVQSRLNAIESILIQLTKAGGI